MEYPEYLVEARKKYDAAIDHYLACGYAPSSPAAAIARDLAYEAIRPTFREYEEAKRRFQSETAS